jgi:Ca2+-binding EF-hand superfamily protein
VQLHPDSPGSRSQKQRGVSGKADGPAVLLKTPGKDDRSFGRQQSSRSFGEKSQVSAPAGSTGGSLKSSLKKKGRSNDSTVTTKAKKGKLKKRQMKRQKTCYEKMALQFGFYVGDVVLKDTRAVEAAQALDLKQWHLRRLRVKFDKIDIDGSGNIDYEEFFEAMGEERSPFTDKLFSLIDLDGSGTIEFDEFVRVLATYCMFTKDEILRFCFECFDVDHSGSIDEKEFIELCKCINNAAPSFPNNFRKALEEFDVNEDGLIDYSEFLELDRRYPLVLFPAFRLQDMMQRNTLGERVWLKVIENYQETRRIEEYKATHGGRAPPDPPMRAFLKTILPCFFQERIHIHVGAEMEARHRNEDR